MRFSPLAPGRAIAARLNFSAKLVLLGVIFTVPLVFLLWANYTKQTEDIEFSLRERDGVLLIDASRRILQPLQLHRGTVQLALNGDAAALAKLPEVTASVDTAFDEAGKIDAAFGAEFETHQPLQDLQSQWETLKSREGKVSASESFEEHTELVGNLLNFIALAADQSNLTLDPDIDTYYTMDAVTHRIPVVSEAVAKMRALSTNIARHRTIAIEERVQLSVILQTFVDNFLGLQDDLNKAMKATASLHAHVDGPIESLQTDGAALNGAVREKILDASAIDADPQAMFAVGSKALDSAFALYDTASPALAELLDLRLAKLGHARTQQLLITAGAYVLVLYLFLSVRSLIVQGMANLTEGAARIAGGDFSREIPVNSRDEVGRLARSLNDVQRQLDEKITAERKIAQEMLRVRIALDNASTGVMIADSERRITYCNGTVRKLLQEAEADIRRVLPEFSADGLVGKSMDMFHSRPGHQADLLARLNGSLTANMKIGKRHITVVANPVINDAGERIGSVAEWRDRTLELEAQQEIASLVQAAGAGDFSRRLPLEGKEGFFRELAVGLNGLAEVTSAGLADVSRVLAALATGDLTQSVEAQYAGVFAELKEGTNTTVARLKEVVARIQDSATSIELAAQEIASGTTDLSSRTEQQASTLEETSSTMEELNITVKQNAQNANQANELARGSNEVAVMGGQMVSQVVGTMTGIQESSRKIADIVGVIDSIAFQTNILALNAAVEAARAGEQGLGFAVVATEVRNLAQRSAGAAKEIKDLIAESVGKVDAGAQLVNQAGGTMEQVVTSFQQVANFVTDIATASREQSVGIEQVTQAVGQMEQVTQQNAGLVAESAQAAASLKQQAGNLVDIVAVFKLEERKVAAPSPTRLPTRPRQRETATTS